MKREPWNSNNGALRAVHPALPRRRPFLDRPVGKTMTVAFIDRPWPIIRANADAHGKMIALVQECPIEIGWLSPCTRVGNTFTITDVFVPQQECTMASTKITKDGEAAVLNDLIEAGKIGLINDLHCWGHSHVNMDVFASKVDEDQTEKFIAKRDQYFVRVIANKHGDFFASVYYLDIGVIVHHPRLEFAAPAIKKWRPWAREQVAKRVSEQVLGYGSDFLYDIDLHLLSQEEIGSWQDLGYLDPRLGRHLLTNPSDFDRRKTKTMGDV